MALVDPPTGPRTSDQLTIFYSGTVNVFNDVPPEKARAIMLLLNSSSYGLSRSDGLPEKPSPQLFLAPPHSATNTPDSVGISVVRFGKEPSSPLSIATKSQPWSVPPPDRSPTFPLMLQSRKRSQSDLPFARKASLARFLERRKDRMETNVNQEASAASTSTTVEVSGEVYEDEMNIQKKAKV